MAPRIRPALFAFAAACCTAALLAAPASAGVLRSTLTRPQDPVVLTGTDAPGLLGSAPKEVVAFRWSAGWIQIPVQVDARAVIDYGTIYGRDPIGIAGLVYTDRTTFTGPDPDPTLDANDEIAFMARDAGGMPDTYSTPPGVDPDSGQVVTITDPLAQGTHGFVFLFRTNAGLKPGAGVRYVHYTFRLLSGEYKDSYHLDAGPNPEHSVVMTSAYAQHFADRWIDDALVVKAGAATGVDILERSKSQFGPGDCSWTESTFANGEGAFIANKNGPVRAIRSYLGAASGPLTERDHIFYLRREDLTTELRMHEIPGFLDYFDYSAEAKGMTYANDANTAGVKVNGVRDVVAGATPLRWELVTGRQGSLIMSHRIDTDIAGLTPTSYYLDDTTPARAQCRDQGRDAQAYAQSGPWVRHTIASTDPGLGSVEHFATSRTLYFEAPGATAAVAQRRDAQAQAPLAFSVAPWTA